MGIGMGPKKIADAEASPPWDGGVPDPLETRYSRTRVTMPTSVVLRSSCSSIIMEIHQKTLTRRVPPFKVTRTLDRHGLIGYQ